MHVFGDDFAFEQAVEAPFSPSRPADEGVEASTCTPLTFVCAPAEGDVGDLVLAA